jgi:CheY-like chemotaxis protein
MASVVIAVMLQEVVLMLDEPPSDLEGRRPCVLIVEDDVLLGTAIGLCVQDAGYEVAGLARSVEAALETLSHETVDAALLDVNL